MLDNEVSTFDRVVGDLGQPPSSVEITVKRGRGRPPLPVEERLRRRAEQKERYAVRSEARRRALIRLQSRHVEEFEVLFAEEFEQMTSN
jgi:hypothetical protein